MVISWFWVVSMQLVYEDDESDGAVIKKEEDSSNYIDEIGGDPFSDTKTKNLFRCMYISFINAQCISHVNLNARRSWSSIELNELQMADLAMRKWKTSYNSGNKAF